VKSFSLQIRLRTTVIRNIVNSEIVQRIFLVNSFPLGLLPYMNRSYRVLLKKKNLIILLRGFYFLRFGKKHQK
jgi:hypothetical protein